MRLKEAFARRVAFSLPRSVAYWCAIRVGAYATQGEYSNQVVPDLLLMDALKRWDAKPGSHQQEIDAQLLAARLKPTAG